jgi:hypothetical protein
VLGQLHHDPSAESISHWHRAVTSSDGGPPRPAFAR